LAGNRGVNNFRNSQISAFRVQGIEKYDAGSVVEGNGPGGDGTDGTNRTNGESRQGWGIVARGNGEQLK